MSKKFEKALGSFFYKVDSEGLSYALENYPMDVADEDVPEDDVPFIQAMDEARRAFEAFEKEASKVRERYEIEES